MVQYRFTISNGEDFSDVEDLANDEEAWRQAVKTVRDVETTLHSTGGVWTLAVAREDTPIYRIEVRAHKLA